MSHYRVIVFTDFDPKLAKLPDGMRWLKDWHSNHKAVSCRTDSLSQAREIASICIDAGLHGVIRNMKDTNEIQNRPGDYSRSVTRRR